MRTIQNGTPVRWEDGKIRAVLIPERPEGYAVMDPRMGETGFAEVQVFEEPFGMYRLEGLENFIKRVNDARESLERVQKAPR